MQRISTLLQKMIELSDQEKKLELIDIDLMLDYTKVVYADLLEVRKNYAINNIVSAKEETVIVSSATTQSSEVEASTQHLQEDVQSLNDVIDARQETLLVQDSVEEEPEEEVEVELVYTLKEETVNQMSAYEEPVVEDAVEPIVTRVPKINYSDASGVDIRTRIGINDKYLFISELFANNASAYDEAVKQLNQFATYGDAEVWVNEQLAVRYNWDKEQETVQSFYYLLSQAFSAT